jgi:hypothetical protein
VSTAANLKTVHAEFHQVGNYQILKADPSTGKREKTKEERQEE